MNLNLNESYLYVGLALHCVAEADIINQTKSNNLHTEKSNSGKEFPHQDFVFNKFDCGSLRVLRQVQIVSIDLGAVAGGQNQLEVLRLTEVFLVLAAQLSL